MAEGRGAQDENVPFQRTRMTRRRVAIIGAGLSGAAVAVNLLTRGREAPDVVLIERNKRFGPGLAYSTNDTVHLLNVRASNMSMYAHKPDHFAKWIGGEASRFAPRMKYGEYIEQTLRKAGGGLFGPKLTRVRDDAVAARPNGEGWSVALASGKSVDADALVLALGNAAPGAPSIFAQNGVELIDPWDVEALTRLPKGDVLLLGAGLTMFDAALSLAKRRKKGVIYALSRRGLTPRSHLDNPKRATPGGIDLPAPLSDALRALRREVYAMAERGEPWQYLMERLRARTPELWQRLGTEQQARFLRHLRPWWDVHRHRAAPEVAARIAALQKAGRLKVLAGEVVSVAPNGAGIDVQHRQRGSFVRHRIKVAGIINCTGSPADPWLSTSPLIRQLLDEGHARAHANTLGFDVDQESRIVSAAGVAQSNLFALGPITMGAYWECTAAPEIRVRAGAIAMMLAPER
jgi:uncharacterized NAD(P)/FAD-binding protein YdhS